MSITTILSFVVERIFVMDKFDDLSRLNNLLFSLEVGETLLPLLRSLISFKSISETFVLVTSVCYVKSDRGPFGCIILSSLVPLFSSYLPTMYKFFISLLTLFSHSYTFCG